MDARRRYGHGAVTTVDGFGTIQRRGRWWASLAAAVPAALAFDDDFRGFPASRRCSPGGT